jgi:hypothetical protein
VSFVPQAREEGYLALFVFSDFQARVCWEGTHIEHFRVNCNDCTDRFMLRRSHRIGFMQHRTKWVG